jgi:hypothetical protein
MFDNFELILESFIKPSFGKSKIKLNKKNNKKISFSTIVRVKLIPFYYEIIQYPSLWWTPCELMDFRIQSSNEILELKQKHPFISIFDAQKLLYQPNNISFDEKNFSYFN